MIMKVDLTLIDRVNDLISKKATGSPKEFARRLGMSESSWYNLKAELQKRGAPIEYSKTLKSYFYLESGAFSGVFEPDK